MLGNYWSILRDAILQATDVHISFCPHPLTPIFLNIKARTDVCFEQLKGCEGQSDASDKVAMLLDSLLESPPEELSVIPELTRDQIGKVDQFIEQARLKLGAIFYPLTYAEKQFIEYAQTGVKEYKSLVIKEWEKQLSQLRTKQQEDTVPPSPPSPAPSAEELQPFAEGEMVFFSDRVELCGLEINSETRSEPRRIILELLAKKTPKGKFVLYSGEGSKLDISIHFVRLR